VKPDDPRWRWLVYATALVPVVGQPVVVVASSILYYRWHRKWPREAFWLNVHAWIAVALNIALVLGIRHLPRR
jgi:hypothetical protein